MTRHQLIHQLIINFAKGVLIALPVVAIGWLILGHPPTLLTVVITGEAISLTIWIAIRARRARERRWLQNTFDKPAYGEDQ